MPRAFASVWSLVDFLARRLELRLARPPHLVVGVEGVIGAIDALRVGEQNKVLIEH
jgi:hypothetical protein